MRIYLKYGKLILSLLFLLFLHSGFVSDNKIDEVLSKLLETIKNTRTLKYTLKNTERIEGELLSGTQDVVFRSSPHKCYLYLRSPNEGAQLLFEKGVNEGRAIYKPNGFPFFKLNLDPMGSLIRNNNHHTLHEIGFGLLGEIIEKLKAKDGISFQLKDSVNWAGKNCFLLTITNNDYKILKYKVQEGETIRSIAYRFSVGEYKILEINEALDDFDNDLEAGQFILIPNSYARYIELYIDKETFLPIFQRIEDEKGLYEQYEYSQLQYNLVLDELFHDDEFN